MSSLETVLFVCIHNSARSQMAEAFVNSHHGDRLRAYSAGLEAGTLNAVVVDAMREAGVDISGNRCKSVNDPGIRSRDYDYVVTVCDEASAEACPIYPTRGERLHWSFPDPSSFTGTADERLARTREVRDAIDRRVDAWAGSLAPPRPLAVRDATPQDAPAITAIYNEGILSGQATFDTEPCSVQEIADDLRADMATHPTVVVVDGDSVVGFAWASSYRKRVCYDGVAEFSVYVASDARGRGVGRLALTALIERCERLGFWKLLSRIFTDNHPSRALCARVGFREVGVYRRHGRLNGEWKDTVIVERLLGEAAQD